MKKVPDNVGDFLYPESCGDPAASLVYFSRTVLTIFWLP